MGFGCIDWWPESARFSPENYNLETAQDIVGGLLQIATIAMRGPITEKLERGIVDVRITVNDLQAILVLLRETNKEIEK